MADLRWSLLVVWPLATKLLGISSFKPELAGEQERNNQQ